VGVVDVWWTCGGDGTPLNYTLVNIADWCKNTFEVISQLRINTDYSHHRYDVLLLVNGVPVAQIELKTLGINPRPAIEQIVETLPDLRGQEHRRMHRQESGQRLRLAHHWQRQDAHQLQGIDAAQGEPGDRQMRLRGGPQGPRPQRASIASRARTYRRANQ
jgi:hypothetical protein